MLAERDFLVANLDNAMTKASNTDANFFELSVERMLLHLAFERAFINRCHDPVFFLRRFANSLNLDGIHSSVGRRGDFDNIEARLESSQGQIIDSNVCMCREENRMGHGKVMLEKLYGGHERMRLSSSRRSLLRNEQSETV